MSSGSMWLDLLVRFVTDLINIFSNILFLYFNLNQKAIEVNNVGNI